MECFGLSWWLRGPPANAGDLGFIHGLGRSPGGGNDNLLQYSFLENPIDRGAWRATVYGVAKSQDMTYLLNNNNGVVWGPRFLWGSTFIWMVSKFTDSADTLGFL